MAHLDSGEGLDVPDEVLLQQVVVKFGQVVADDGVISQLSSVFSQCLEGAAKVSSRSFKLHFRVEEYNSSKHRGEGKEEERERERERKKRSKVEKRKRGKKNQEMASCFCLTFSKSASDLFLLAWATLFSASVCQVRTHIGKRCSHIQIHTK